MPRDKIPERVTVAFTRGRWQPVNTECLVFENSEIINNDVGGYETLRGAREAAKGLNALAHIKALDGKYVTGKGDCPVCGERVTVIKVLGDFRLLGSCQDAFTERQWIEGT